MPVLAVRRAVLRLAAVALLASPIAAPIASPAFAADPAAELISSTAAQVIDIIKTTTPSPARQNAIQQVLETKFDLRFMAQTALGIHWAKTTPEQQTRFLKATVFAEARAYSERFGSYLGQTLTLGKTTSRPNGVYIVDSRLNQSNGQPIKLEWEVRQEGAQGLRITDVKVEGVSMVMTRRSDFNSYIQNNGGKVQPLIDELEARAAR